MDLLILLFLVVLVLLLAMIIGVFIFLRRRAALRAEAAGAAKAKKGEKKPLIRKSAKAAPPQPAAPAADGAAARPAPPTLTGPQPPVIAGDKVRILIVDDNVGTLENVTRLLYFEENMEVIGQAENGRKGLEMAIALKPHIVLMDINMPDMDGITACNEMSVKAPFSQVIIMSVQSDHHYMKRAMAAGARDFQPKPFTSDELVNCIRRVYKIGIPMYQKFEAVEQAKTHGGAQSIEAAAPARTTAPVIAVYGPKGGVGTSAIAANLAVALHQLQGDTVLMDGALQFGDILVHLNTRPTRTIADLIHDGTLESDLLVDVLLPHESGLKLMLAPPQPQMADVIPAKAITEVIEGLQHQFKLVLVDTDSQLTDKTLAILDVADYILMLTTAELPSIKSARLFLEVADQLGFAEDRLLVVINRSDVPGSIRPDQVEEVLKLNKTYRIPHDPRLHAALSRGVAICQHDPSAPSAQAITRLAQAVRDRLSAGEKAPVKQAA